MRAIVLISKDGLGNQMFQYAFARTLQQKYGVPKLYICTEGFRDDRNKRSFSLGHLALNDSVEILNGVRNKAAYKVFREYVKFCMNKKEYASCKDLDSKIEFLQERGLYYEDWGNPYMDFQVYETGKPVAFVKGDFQNLSFWEDMSGIRKELFPTRSLEGKSAEILKKIQENHSVCVHVRRGDYVDPKTKWFKMLNICTQDYYLKAMDYMASHVEKPVFYLFSNTADDVEYIMNTYAFRYEVIPVCLNNSDYEDLQLMAACRHFILSNSTYSFWAQYLSDYGQKVVIAPKRWNNKVDASNIYMNDWVTVECDV